MQRVVVGLSGGVDSAASAALLKEQGYEVIGAYIKIWSPEFLECTWQQDRIDAKRVAVALGIPFLEVDLSSDYRKHVIADMLSAYQCGITPNPDVLCNRKIKFGSFAAWAMALGADSIATGHYAQIKQRQGEWALLRGTDAAKDQSYFLYLLTQGDLARTYFPVGGLTKSEVRKKAVALQLPVAKKADSQGLCFVGDITMKDFLARFIALDEGQVVDERGTIIGTHDGAALYTLGQRHGFHLYPAVPAGPYFVTQIDAVKNQIIVSRNKDASTTSIFYIQNPHWIGTRRPRAAATAAVRYHAKEAPMRLNEGVRCTVAVEVPQTASPGQSVVFYEGNECLGGAVIERT